VLLFACNIPIQAQITVSTQEQTIENKVRLNELEKKVDAQDKEMHNIYDKKQVELEAKFELKKENLDYKRGLVGWWLSVLGLLIAFFGIGVPIAGYVFSRNFTKDFNKQKEKSENDFERLKDRSKEDIDLFISTSTEKLKMLEERAHICIANLRKLEKDGIDITIGLKNLFQKSIDTKSFDSDKNELKLEAEKLGKKAVIGSFEKEMAESLELYFDEKYEEALPRFLKILKTFREDINLESLSSIYAYIANSYAKTSQYDKAIEYYYNAIKLDDNYYAVWNNLGNLYGKSNEIDKAIECYKKAIKINNKYFLAYKNLIEILILNNKFEDVQKYLNIVKTDLEKDDCIIRLLDIIYSVIHMKWTKNLNETIEEFKKNAEKDPSMIRWSFNLIDNWLSSDIFSNLSTKQQDFITELIRLIEEWRKEVNKE
jgi:tetratricopeptide (TPR) repeat protein